MWAHIFTKSTEKELISILLLTSGAATIVMAKLFTTLLSSQTSWTGPECLKWDEITYDNSNRIIAINILSKSLIGILQPTIN
ncbi:hypothetical protein R6Q57_009127 [Mikania cordata]